MVSAVEGGQFANSGGQKMNIEGRRGDPINFRGIVLLRAGKRGTVTPLQPKGEHAP